MDCGPTCLRMVARYFGKSYSLQYLRERSGVTREGISLLGISEAAEAIGFRTMGVRTNFEQFTRDVPLPCIVHWQQSHYLVVYKIRKSYRRPEEVLVADPARGLLTYSKAEFLAGWQSDEADGIALLLSPTAQFYAHEAEEKKEPAGMQQLFHYLLSYKKLIVQLFLGLLVGSALQLVLPFLMQSIVDVGINMQNLNFIYLVLAAQLMLFLGRTSVEFIRGWILLHISARLNISILSGFLIKLMRLPLAFFDVKLFGDLLQRITDHQRIEAFLTGTSLNTVFSLFNLAVFGAVLAYYHATVFLIFAGGTLLYVAWVAFFLRHRRKLDAKRFDTEAKNQGSLVQLIQGMQEIKLANSERQKRWEWERIRARLFHLSVEGLALNQYQQAGALFINEGKNIFITFFAAKAVINGELTLGAMLALQYIIGQLNSPIEQLILFLQTMQDAMLSLERFNEIHSLEDEEPEGRPLVIQLPANQSLSLRKVSFTYPGTGNEPVLRDIDLYIPQGKTTAIVGTSGSGKTSLLKLVLKFYAPSSGEVRLGELNLQNVSHKLWRNQCGVVMQDGFIFSDTIVRNIAVGEEHPDVGKILHAIKVANIEEFIYSLPLGYNTKIGAEGNGISQGQKQRILIARAVYKNPSFLFFDEATNALDATNESVIMQNLESFFEGRTVVVVAHRLSTVRNADQIVVLNKGVIVEQGTHEELTYRRGDYFHLVKNQLELGA